MEWHKLAYFLILFLRLKGCLVNCEREISCEVRTRIESGWICGRRREADNGAQYASFRGVPYAKQPLDSLRFQELRPPIPWDGYLDATEERPACPQHDELYGRLMKTLQGTSEACIYANVHVPIKQAENKTDEGMSHNIPLSDTHDKDGYRNKRNNEGLPILVYIHGGGFKSGSGDSDLNGPEYLVSRGVIVITFNYRLNVFGFLSLSSAEIPGNQGLRDQMTLLRWVRRNARAFGGDPDNVTLMGQSSGAACAHLISLSEATHGLFRRVILSSGTANPGFYTASPLYSKAVAALFLSELGINFTSSTEIHDRLVNMPLNKILLANSRLQYRTGIITFAPVVETPFPGVTRVLDDDPTELVKRGRGNHYPLMVGFNTEECAFFRALLEYLQYKTRIELNPALLLNPNIVFRTPPNMTLQLARQAVRKYFKGRFTYDEYERSCSETLFQYPSFQLANIRASMKGAPVYLYQFAYKSKLNFVQKAGWFNRKGTAHVEDLNRVLKPNAFIEDIGAEGLPEKDEHIKQLMTKFVVNFMTCSNPTCTSSKAMLPPWPAVQKEKFNYQNIEDPREYPNNRGPTHEQWDLIQFNEYVEAESRRAISDQRVLTEGNPTEETFMNNITAAFNLTRPPYPFAIVYVPKVQKSSRFKHIEG